MDNGVDTCLACGSSSLFDTDVEPGHEGETVTVCNDCGAVQQDWRKEAHS